MRLEPARQLSELAKMFGIDPDDRGLLKSLEIEFPQLQTWQCRELSLHIVAELRFNKSYRCLVGEKYFQRPNFCC